MMGMCVFPVAYVRAKASFLPCRKQSPGCQSAVRARHNTGEAEGGRGPRVGAEQPPAGLKELNGFEQCQQQNANCGLESTCLKGPQKVREKTLMFFLHPCLWLPSQHRPINEERMVLARFCFHLCTNQFIDSCLFHPSNDNSMGLCRFHAINVSAINFPFCWAPEQIKILTFCSKFLL